MNIKPKYHTLYSITCLSNSKTYIGVCLWWQQRKGKHLYDLRNNKHANFELQNDYRAYGEESIVFDIISVYDNKNEALLIEKYYTDVVFCKNKDICYNILSGGANVAEQMRAIYQHKIKTDISFRTAIGIATSARMTGRKLSNETKGKIRQKAIGRQASDETRTKFSENRKRGGNSRAKKVIDTKTGKMYDCLKDAAEDIGVNYDMIKCRINGYNKQTTTLQWLH